MYWISHQIELGECFTVGVVREYNQRAASGLAGSVDSRLERPDFARNVLHLSTITMHVTNHNLQSL
jgi:hypothetical protein